MRSGGLAAVAIGAAMVALFVAVVPAQTSSVSASERAIRSVFHPDRADRAVCIAGAESTGDHDGPPYRLYPRAVGAAGELGLFQIHPVHFGNPVGSGRWRMVVDRGRLFDAVYNARVAFAMSGGGRFWRPAWNATAGYCGA